MKYTKLILHLLLITFTIIFSSCQGQPKHETPLVNKDDNNGKPIANAAIQRLTKGKGSLSFKLDGQLYKTDPLHTKCWTTTGIPLAMLMARGDGMSISWQMGYEEGKKLYKLDGDSKGTINFTIGGKTYWTRKDDNYLDIVITNIKDKYSLKLLSGTFEGVLEDKDGNKVQITEGSFVTEDI